MRRLLKYGVLPGIGATVVMDFVNHLGAFLGIFYKIDLIMIGSLITAWLNHSFFFQKPPHLIHMAQDLGFGASPGFGLLCHYAIGISFSCLFWMIAVTLRFSRYERYVGAVVFGGLTSFVSLLIVFPALGAGWFASKGGHLVMLGSVVNHFAFGVGLALSYWLFPAPERG